jgi:hypothetical protein
MQKSHSRNVSANSSAIWNSFMSQLLEDTRPAPARGGLLGAEETGSAPRPPNAANSHRQVF